MRRLINVSWNQLCCNMRRPPPELRPYTSVSSSFLAQPIGPLSVVATVVTAARLDWQAASIASALSVCEACDERSTGSRRDPKKLLPGGSVESNDQC